MANDHSENENHGHIEEQGGHGEIVDTQGPETEHSPSTHPAATGHGPDTSDVSTLVPVTWKQLIFPAAILVIVIILVAGPIMNAFGPASTTGGQTSGQVGQQAATTVTAVPSGSEGQTATATVQPTPAQPTPTTAAQVNPTAHIPSLIAIATQTAVALAGEQGVVTRAPVELQFGGVQFKVEAGNELLPDWKPSTDPGTATWIQGTYANHVLYVPFTPSNESLFQNAKAGDQLGLTMNTDQTFVFQVTREVRAVNGPATADGQFTVTAAMAQDHAGVTLFLIGDPAPDRAVLQADFTGTIQ